MLLASFSSAVQAAADTAAANPTWSFAAIVAAIVGVLKMFGIGPTQYKEYVGKLIALIAGKVPGDTVVERIGLATLEQLLDALIDRLLTEGVEPDEAKKIVNDIAPKVQKARLARFEAAVAEKCGKDPSPAKGALPKLTEAL